MGPRDPHGQPPVPAHAPPPQGPRPAAPRPPTPLPPAVGGGGGGRGGGSVELAGEGVAGGGAGVEQIRDLEGNLLPINSFVPVFWNIPLIPAPLSDT